MRRIPPKTTNNARKLRKNMTNVERVLWARIRKCQLKGFRFRRQYPIGRYIVDFVCLELKLIIELDGGQHMQQHQYDEKRDQWLIVNGFEVLRFWNNEILEDINAVLMSISLSLPPSHKNPLPL